MKPKKTTKGQIPAADKELFMKMKESSICNNEREFFEKMENKEFNEYPVSSFDVILSELDNDAGLYFVKCYASEYLIGVRTATRRAKFESVPTSLSEALAADLFPLINEHISLLEWLRKRDFRSLRYDYDWEE